MLRSGDDYGSFTYAGFDGLGLPAHEKEEPYIFHFPDGNASIARLLVRSMFPPRFPAAPWRCCYGASRYATWITRKIPSAAAEQYGRERETDRQKSRRERMFRSPTCVRETLRVKGNYCVLACYNVMIPYICPELPEGQKEALRTL